jgi:hypothetical protein
MAQLFWLSGQSLVDGTGTPYAGAKANFYETGTTTPKATYSNAGLSSANTNPVVADSDGRFGLIYLVAGRYKIVLTDANDVQIGDNLDPVDGVLSLIQSASAPSPTYAFMRYHNTSDGNVYRRSSDNLSWINEGPVDGLGNAASVTQQLAGTATDAFSTPDSVAGLWQRGADIASATTISLPAAGGYDFNLTGTTTVTGISSAQGGRKVRFKTAAAVTFTHNGTSFVMPGGVSVAAPAGSLLEFTNDAAQDASGSNWRLTDYLSGAVPVTDQSSAKTTNYTVADTDRGGVIRFSGMSADATLTLPAASGRAGFRFTFINLDGTYGVTVDGNASETIDTFTTRKTFGPDPIQLYCDGSNWFTISGAYLYDSGDQTITASGTLSLAHGLGTRPRRIWTQLRCTTSEGNYSVGDYVTVGPTETDGATHRGVQIAPDATNLTVLYASSANTFAVPNKTTRANFPITNASWRLRVFAES